ncbi:MAG: outer membrane protein OmpA-like peptidoglycan-associated protein [Myxococcota bacterium]|jgi:outer membrane protein OmpA-like peptidoglycan-associated protein
MRLGNNAMKHVLIWSTLALMGACSTAVTTAGKEKAPPVDPAEVERTEENVRILKLEAKARKLEETSKELYGLRGKHDEVMRRLTAICVDHPDHRVCQPHSAAKYAREAFCADTSFTSHVDEIVEACHQGQCKQIDEARLLKRSQYMTLVTRLPHSLITFGSGKTRLDRKDKRQTQQFMEQMQADGGYIIIVGRASRDGKWRTNLKLALERAESTRAYVVDTLGFDPKRVGYITYGHDKMYLTELDAERLSEKKMSVRQANRSALLFAYPCHGAKPSIPTGPDPEPVATP